MRKVLYIVVAIAAFAAIGFALLLWTTRVTPVEKADIDIGLGHALNGWLDERHSHWFSQWNGVALVIRDGEVIVRDAWGTDGEGRPLTPESQFRLASVSKSFTAAAILVLVEKGLLDLDTPVSEQVENCPVLATPAQIMRHQSGIADDYFQVADPDEITTVAWVFSLVCGRPSDVELPAPFSYNNTGYVFLAGIIEALSGQSFESFLAEEILAPLGMDKTRVWNLLSDDDFPERATSFDREGQVLPTNLDGVAGDGAVFSSVDDLENWARFWRDDRLIPSQLKHRATGAGGASGYHFGLTRRGDLVAHSGSWLGARTYFGFKDTGVDGDIVILLDNGSSYFINDIATQVWRAIDGG